ncbi:MAG: hypothetical protein HOP23_13200 [Methylococcaceae bacterium]|nr:hypothetical protein [Methylococcaceae bacterium]
MKLILANLVVGILLIYLGCSAGGLGLMVAWLGVGFILTGLGYAGIDARIYGKNETGDFPWWSIMLYMPFFCYTLATWHVVQCLIRERSYDWITGDLIVGRRLWKREYPENVQIVVDLTAEFHEPKSVIENIAYISLPILDGHIPEIHRMNDALDKLTSGITYIHCGQGHGRSGLIAALLLARQGIIRTPQEAILLLKSKRPKLGLTAKQFEFLCQQMQQYQQKQR